MIEGPFMLETTWIDSMAF